MQHYFLQKIIITLHKFLKLKLKSFDSHIIQCHAIIILISLTLLIIGMDIPHLCQQLQQCVNKWQDIAKHLGFTGDEIKKIKPGVLDMIEGVLSDPKSPLAGMIELWSSWAPGDARGSTGCATLNALQMAIHEAGFPEIAKELGTYSIYWPK